MARPRSIPKYRKHRQSGQAIVTLNDHLTRDRKDYLLGKFGSAESRLEYARLLAEWEANGRRIVEANATANRDLTVSEMLVAFFEHAKKHYRRADGSLTSEVQNYDYAVRQLKELYIHTQVRDFGPLALRAVRKEMVKANISRKVINNYVNRIRHIFKWAGSLEIISPAIYEALRTVPALERGRSEARDNDPVTPVPEEHVDAVLPYLLAQTRGIVELMRYTGMRPGEAVQIRRADIDMSGPVWIYKPRHHKMSYRGLNRVVPIGPKGQEILRPFFKPDLEVPLFSPREAMQSFWEEQRANRKTKVYAYQLHRNRNRRLKQLSDVYTVVGLDVAIRRASIKAGVPSFGANRLRHLHATNIRKRFGIEAASTVLGHNRLDTTQIYAEKDIEMAKRVAAEVG